jgi:hypothetical protein
LGDRLTGIIDNHLSRFLLLGMEQAKETEIFIPPPKKDSQSINLNICLLVFKTIRPILHQRHYRNYRVNADSSGNVSGEEWA